MLNQIQYPSINFWDRIAKKIRFINREDFREEKLLELLNVDSSELKNSFGIVDRGEILKRQRLIKFFVEHPKVLDFLISEGDRSVSLPNDGQMFLDYFNPAIRHNPFWTLVRRFASIMSRYKTVPPEIKSFASFLRNTTSFLEKEEKQMAEGIAKRASKATYLEGAITFSADVGPGSHRNIRFDKGRNYSEVHGYKLYSQELSELREYKDTTGWASRKFWRKMGVFGLINLILKARVKWVNKRLYSPLRIVELPESILEEIIRFLENNLIAVLFPRSEKSNNEIDLQVFFRYSGDGLRIRVLGVSVKELNREGDQKTYVSFLKQEFPGYSRRMIREMVRKNEILNEQAEQIDRKVYNYQLLGAMRGRFPNLFYDSMQLINSPVTDDLFKWHSIANLYAHPDFNEAYKRSRDFRDYYGSTMRELRLIAKLAYYLLNKSIMWKKPLCFPVILDDHNHLVSFESLEPIHLLSEEEELVAIKSLPALNGQLIGLTGQNKGGKSTTEEAIVNAIYLAQSGLPVFGRKFALNVKNKIGMVFLERGFGSTLEMLLKKTKKILEELDGYKENGTVLILDEVGTGTQEIDGFGYGKKLLEKLSKSSCSVIFSTQITDLAKYARDKLSAECFNFDLNHQIRPGIGRGGIEKLMFEIGIQELLN